MPLPIPDLDDRRFEDLVGEARALIPTLAPDWTNHNASDPGVTLVELFAHLTELLIYRLNRVTSENVCAFLNLLDSTKRRAPARPGSHTIEVQPAGDPPPTSYTTDLSVEIRDTIRALRTIERAISCEDFETLAFDAVPDGTLVRAHCMPLSNLDAGPDKDQPGHVSVIVVPTDDAKVQDVVKQVHDHLISKVLLTTQLHVVPPVRVNVTIAITVAARRDVLPDAVTRSVTGAINDFLDPRHGGKDRNGWPFGRAVFVSELYALVSQLPEVRYASKLTLGPAARWLRGDDGSVIGLALKPYELVQAAMTASAVTIENGS